MLKHFIKNKTIYGLFILSSCLASVKAEEAEQYMDTAPSISALPQDVTDRSQSEAEKIIVSEAMVQSFHNGPITPEESVEIRSGNVEPEIAQTFSSDNYYDEELNAMLAEIKGGISTPQPVIQQDLLDLLADLDSMPIEESTSNATEAQPDDSVTTTNSSMEAETTMTEDPAIPPATIAEPEISGATEDISSPDLSKENDTPPSIEPEIVEELVPNQPTGTAEPAVITESPEVTEEPIESLPPIEEQQPVTETNEVSEIAVPKDSPKPKSDGEAALLALSESVEPKAPEKSAIKMGIIDGGILGLALLGLALLKKKAQKKKKEPVIPTVAESAKTDVKKTKKSPRKTPAKTMPVSYQELPDITVKSTSDLRAELLQVNNFSMPELTQSLEKGNMPADQIACVKAGIEPTRQAQYQRLVAIRKLNYINQERKKLSALAKEADAETLNTIKLCRRILTEERRAAMNLATGNKLLALKEQRRLLTKQMRIARRRDDAEMQEKITRIRQQINQQEKEIKTFVRELKYPQIRQSFLKQRTKDMIAKHFKEDKLEKRRIQSANRKALKLLVTTTNQKLLPYMREA